MSNTVSYKQGFIHCTGKMVLVQVDKYAYPIEVKSFHAAKLMITKHAIRG